MQLYYLKKDGNGLADSSVVLMVVALIYKFVLVVWGVLMLLFWHGRLIWGAILAYICWGWH